MDRDGPLHRLHVTIQQAQPSPPLPTISHLPNAAQRRHTSPLPGTPLAARLIWRSHPIEPLVFHGRASRIAPDSAADHTSSAVAAELIPGAGRLALLCTSCETCQPQTPRSRCGRRQSGGENHGWLSYMQARAVLMKMRWLHIGLQPDRTLPACVRARTSCSGGFARSKPGSHSREHRERYHQSQQL